MRWIAPSEKDVANHALEKSLWAAADRLRANSGLTSAQYSTPDLGLQPTCSFRYTKELCKSKSEALVEHVYDAYLGEGTSVYSQAA